MVASVSPFGGNGTDVMFSRSTDGGATFSAPHRINDDPVNPNKWHWFGTIGVAPNGRIDSVWLDSRNAANNIDSQLFYSYSTDGGVTWAPNVAVSQFLQSSGRLAATEQDRRLYHHRVGQHWRRRGLLGHLQLQPEQGSARTGCLFRSCIAKPVARRQRPLLRLHRLLRHSRQLYADVPRNSHRNHYAERYSYRYAEADAHAAIRADAQAASYTGAETVEKFAERRFLVIGDQFTIGLSGP